MAHGVKSISCLSCRGTLESRPDMTWTHREGTRESDCGFPADPIPHIYVMQGLAQRAALMKQMGLDPGNFVNPVGSRAQATATSLPDNVVSLDEYRKKKKLD